jgi:zinc transport system substrate-binding protein
MKLAKLSLGLLLSIGLPLTGCSSSTETGSPESNKLTVYTTIYPLQDFAEKIGGKFVDVKSIYPPNVDAHSFEPSTKDMIKLAEADLFIYSGAGIEGFAEKAQHTLENEKVLIVKAAENVEMLESSHEHSHEGEENHVDGEQNEDDPAHSGEEHHEDDTAHSDQEHHEDDTAHFDEEQHKDGTAHSNQEQHEDDSAHSDQEHHDGEDTTENAQHKNYDPHVWLDPILSIKLASNIKDSLIQLMPEHEEEFKRNFAQLEQDLKQLDKDFAEVTENAATKHLLVAHEAYGYWSNRYGIIQIAVNGLSPTQEPSQRELTKLIEQAKEHELEYIAFESNVTSGVAEMIQRELGAEAVTLYNLESITTEDIKNHEDYFSLMRKNLQTLEKVLN